MKTVGYRRDAARSLLALPPKVQAQIVAKLARYAETGAGNVTALKGHPGKRLRSGDYRVVFIETAEAIDVLAVGHRKHVYD